MVKLKVLLAHPGTQYSFQLAKELHRNDMLYRFHTGLAFGKDGWVYKFFSRFPPVYKKLSNRFIDDVPDRFIKRHPFIEIKALLKIKLGYAEEDVLYRRNLFFQKNIDDAGIKTADVVIGFDTSSWILAARCRQLGKKFVLDVSIGHPLSKENIYKELGRAYGEWKEQVQPKKKAFIEFECAEMELADIIIVPSHFVKETLIENGVAAAKIRVNPFGTFVSEFRANPSRNPEEGKLRFLFLGSFTARKGLPMLLKAWDELDIRDGELTIAGYGKLPASVVLSSNVKNLGTIAKEERQRLFDNADVFLFPSFFEGLAQVQIEAMACGLPVVGTKNSGADELVEEGVNGFIIEAGNNAQLKAAINFFLTSPMKIKHMGIKAREKAEQFSWDAYGARLKRILEDAAANKTVNNAGRS